MYIQKVQLTNIRGFREVELDLKRPDGSFAGWTVLAGRNGSGKSTLLKAMALAVVGPDAARALQPNFADWLRAGSSKARAEIGMYFMYEDSKDLSSAVYLEWFADKEIGEPILIGPDSHRDWASVKESLIASRQRRFLAAYGPYRRLSGHAVDAQRLMEGPDPISRVVSLFREDASLVESVSWLREIYLLRLENRPGAAELEKAVLNLLDDGLLPDCVRVDQVDSEGLWVFQYGIRLPLRELSDGYRTTAALVMDIVRHLQRTFGEFLIEQAEDEEGQFWRVLHKGVVLVDEIDLHLHISWQQRVGFWLKRHFPNIQFIVTTHSPFICQAADPRGLIRLSAPGEDRPVEHVPDALYNTIVNGSIDDVILTELFGLDTPYSKETERLRQSVAELEAKLQTGRATDKDRQELRALRSRLPRTMSSSVEQALRALTVEE